MRPLVPPYIESLSPYIPGRDAAEVCREYGLARAFKLASNENPLGPSPKAVEAMRQALADVHVYPNTALGLREYLAAHFGLRIENVITGSGSEGIMSNIIRTFLCDDDEVLAPEPTFAGFRVLAQSRGVAYRSVPHRNWHLDLQALAGAVTPRTKIIYLANPNNPTGTIFTREEFEDFYRHVPPHVLILLDEAYFEYAQDDPAYPDSLHYRYDNVITLRTFSKAYGLAGVRVGYGFAHGDLIRNLLKVKLPFEPSTLGQAAGIAALQDGEFLTRSLAHNRAAVEFLTKALRGMGLAVVPSKANFVMVVLDSASQAAALNEGLLRKGMIVRHLTGFGLPQALRITAGTNEANALCVEAIAELTGATSHAASR
ncbi:MAG: histidinol-phosphate transaminase [Bryobacterales bacterium]|nr:histidinol-phosphate transaminase [Bryobacterales bacterium]